MSKETRQDIESEIGHNGWGLARKIIAGVTVALAVQTVAYGFILAEWKGAVTERLAQHISGGHPNTVIARIYDLETRLATSSERTINIANNVIRLENLENKHFDELKKLIEAKQ